MKLIEKEVEPDVTHWMLDFRVDRMLKLPKLVQKRRGWLFDKKLSLSC